MLNWFAPALVALRGATAVEAMKLSFFSCLRNWVPFLVYGLIVIGVAMRCGDARRRRRRCLFGAGAMMGGDTGSGIGALRRLRHSCSWSRWQSFALVVGPIVFGSTYAGYKDTLAVETRRDARHPQARATIQLDASESA